MHESAPIPAMDGAFEWAIRIQHRTEPDNQQIRQFERGTVRIGASSSHDVQLEASAFGFPELAIIVSATGHVILEQKGRYSTISPGDAIYFGNYQIELVGEPQATGQPARPRPAPETRPVARANQIVQAALDASPIYEVTLTVSTPNKQRHEHKTQQREIELGRSKDRHVVLDDPGLGKLHCTLFVTNRGEVFVRDHNSLNGTYVNGELIRDVAVVHPGDLIRLAKHTISLDKPPTPINSQAIAYQASTRPAWREKRKLVQVRGADDPTCRFEIILCVNQPGVSRRDVTLKRNTIKIGRAKDNDLVLPSPSVSKRHALLHVDNTGRVTLQDCGSYNGTFLAQKKLGQGAVQLRDERFFSVGEFEITIKSLSATL